MSSLNPILLSFAGEDPTDPVISRTLILILSEYFPGFLINSFRIIFNEFFDADYTLLEDKMYWSTSSTPYAHKDVSNLLLEDNEI